MSHRGPGRRLQPAHDAATGPTRQPTEAPAPTEAPTAPTTGARPHLTDTLRIGFVPGALERTFGLYAGFRHASDRFPWGIVLPPGVAHAALYRPDDRFEAIPDLADGPCEPTGSDGTVIRCRLVEATFHDGTPVTAEDVAYTYQVFQHRPPFLPDIAGRLKEVRVVDGRTVDFVLSERDPTFLTESLQLIPILPRHVVEASFAGFTAATEGLEAADLTALADAIDDEIARDPKVCSPRLEAVAALIDRIGITLYREDFTDAATGTLDACQYMAVAGGYLRQTAVAMGKTGLDAVAAAWQLLGIDWRPVGAGPYRFVSEDAGGMHFEAWPAYHGGPPATRYLDFVATTADGAGVEDGTIDILQGIRAPADPPVPEPGPDVRVATPPEIGFIALHFNVRPGRLFADPALRLALQQCVDLERDVDAATAGTGIPIYTEVTRGTWAYEPDLPRPDRDPEAARARIEAAGWSLGEDGIYAKDGTRLAAEIVLRGEVQERVRMVDLLAKDARDCGMDLRPRPSELGAILDMLRWHPHDIPGTDRPFDLYVGGLTTGFDPGSFTSVASWHATSAERPDADAVGGNLSGLADPVVDGLVREGKATYDQEERARLYRELQREVAARLPVMYLWGNNRTDLVRSAVAEVDGPLDLAATNWAWRPERMVLEAGP